MPVQFSDALLAFLADRSAFCYAMQDILQKVGGAKAVRLPGDRSALPDDVWSVDFKRGRATGDRIARAGVGDGTREEYSLFTGVAEIKRGIPKDSNIESKIPGCMTKLDEDEAIVRACLLRSAHYFTAGRLPNFAINDIIETQPPTYGTDSTNNINRDVFILYFEIHYERLRDSFPAA